MIKSQSGTRAISVLFVVLFILFSLLGVGGGVSVRADTSVDEYSGALGDLKRDPNFNPEDYPANSKDYSLQVIQIAEGVNNELFIYVYQPSYYSKSLTATSINISTSETSGDTGVVGGELKYRNYELELLDRTGIFGKYLVKNLTAQAGKTTRYYTISSIFRTWDKSIDEGTGNDNTISEVSYKVAQSWSATTQNGAVTYARKDIKVVTITDKYVGKIRYLNGFKFSNLACDSWYVAFSADYQIDELYEADLEYITRPYSVYLKVNASLTTDIERIEYGAYSDPIFKTVKNSDLIKNDPSIFFKKHTWDRIESIETFTANEELTPEASSHLTNKQWVLRFTETSVTGEHTSLTTGRGDYTEVSEVTILRLKFQTDGVTYNLGVVDNKQTGTKPSNPLPTLPGLPKLSDIPWWVWAIVALVILAILLPVLSAIFPTFKQVLLSILKGFGCCFKYLFIGLCYVISAPFKLIARGVQSAQERREQPTNTLGTGKIKKTKPKQGGKK